MSKDPRNQCNALAKPSAEQIRCVSENHQCKHSGWRFHKRKQIDWKGDQAEKPPGHTLNQLQHLGPAGEPPAGTSPHGAGQSINSQHISG